MEDLPAADAPIKVYENTYIMYPSETQKCETGRSRSTHARTPSAAKGAAGAAARARHCSDRLPAWPRLTSPDLAPTSAAPAPARFRRSEAVAVMKEVLAEKMVGLADERNKKGKLCYTFTPEEGAEVVSEIVGECRTRVLSKHAAHGTCRA